MCVCLYSAPRDCRGYDGDKRIVVNLKMPRSAAIHTALFESYLLELAWICPSTRDHHVLWMSRFFNFMEYDKTDSKLATHLIVVSCLGLDTLIVVLCLESKQPMWAEWEHQRETA